MLIRSTQQKLIPDRHGSRGSQSPRAPPPTQAQVLRPKIEHFAAWNILITLSTNFSPGVSIQRIRQIIIIQQCIGLVHIVVSIILRTSYYFSFVFFFTNEAGTHLVCQGVFPVRNAPPLQWLITLLAFSFWKRNIWNKFICLIPFCFNF